MNYWMKFKHGKTLVSEGELLDIYPQKEYVKWGCALKGDPKVDKMYGVKSGTVPQPPEEKQGESYRSEDGLSAIRFVKKEKLY